MRFDAPGRTPAKRSRFGQRCSTAPRGQSCVRADCVDSFTDFAGARELASLLCPCWLAQRTRSRTSNDLDAESSRMLGVNTEFHSVTDTLRASAPHACLVRLGRSPVILHARSAPKCGRFPPSHFTLSSPAPSPAVRCETTAKALLLYMFTPRYGHCSK